MAPRGLGSHLPGKNRAGTETPTGQGFQKQSSHFWLGEGGRGNLWDKGHVSTGQSPVLPNQNGRDEEEAGSQEKREPLHEVQRGWVECVEDT